MSQINVDNIRNRAGGAFNAPSGINVTGVVTTTSVSATSGSFSGNVSIGGILTYEDVTNIDSVGIITARSGVSIADSIFHTGDTNTAIRFPAVDTFTVETAGSEALRVDSSQRLMIGTQTPGPTAGEHLTIEDSANAGITIRSGTTAGGAILFEDDTADRGEIQYSHNGDFLRIKTAGSERLRITSTGGVHFNNAELIERVSIVANKLSAVPNVNLDNGMVHYYTTNETTTANPNIITTAGINTNMATGDTMSVTIMSKPNGAGYFPRISIDGSLTGITTYWSGGSAPSSAEASGVDVNVYQIIKTADATFDVLANTSNFA